MSERVTALLNALKALLEKYDVTLEAFLKYQSHHSSLKDLSQCYDLLRQLRAELTHLEYVAHSINETPKDRQSHFFERHLKAVNIATEHWYYIHHHLIMTPEEREAMEASEVYQALIALHERMLHLQNELTEEDIEEMEQNPNCQSPHLNLEPHLHKKSTKE